MSRILVTDYLNSYPISMKRFIRTFQGLSPVPAGMPAILLCLAILSLPLDAVACSWGGDVETKYDTMLPEIASGGRHIPQILDRESTRLPEGFGFGLVVTEPGHGIPYLQSTFGRPISRIEDLRAFGVRAVVDLGPRNTVSTVRSTDGKLRSLGYFNIPVESIAPGVAQIENFHDLLLDADNRPLIVIAPTAEILAVTWAAYRLHLGAPLAFAIYEGKSMDLQSEQESALLDRRQN